MNRNKIFELVKQYYTEQFAQKVFEPGKTMIPFAGRVFDEEELVSLIDASLDFWLTTGRYAEEFEAGFAKYMQQRSCILVNSGSSANLIALSSLTSPLLKSKNLQG
jgi:CDP-6-deoxy-D-xylo-4-hexulose-3-dehydrase